MVLDTDGNMGYDSITTYREAWMGECEEFLATPSTSPEPEHEREFWEWLVTGEVLAQAFHSAMGARPEIRELYLALVRRWLERATDPDEPLI